MNLYLISQTERSGYDTFDSAVVCAPSESEAVLIHPRSWENLLWSEYFKAWMSPYYLSYCYVYPERFWDSESYEWASHPSHVQVKFLGVASEEIPFGIVCSSYNAG